MALSSASQSRRIFFKSRGGTYSAIFMSDSGDLFQQYTGTATAMTDFFPKYSTASPANLKLTITSSRSTGTITPASVTYRVAGITLAFNTAGTCTTTTKNMNTRFRLYNGVLQVIGNLADIADGSGFIIEAEARISSEADSDILVAHLPVSVAPYTDSKSAVVTIAPGDEKNFTLTSENDSVILVARIYADGAWVLDTSAYTFEWYKLTSAGWGNPIQNGSNDKLTVMASMVDTYADFRVVVKKSGAEIGSDTQGVLDASDPYDIITSIKIYKGSGSATDTNDETLTDDMPDNAYLEYTASMVVRGTTAALTGATWDAGHIVSADGLKMQTVTPNSNRYQVTVGMLKACGGTGEYEFVFSCSRNS